eukprot:CAMPEP_0196143280 /NCGR_PEP_ID=MMETSP0910-20130528/13036_1 /TAXON_ID=49265 /ORGANISM="Thalassiosira rotula, Strain GSO102" /LENGTH=328 /DNA_ID=CAMNT_0041404717 /DNA_START=58 /DNA_END=1044 /DNA_ORIENTATION=-
MNDRLAELHGDGTSNHQDAAGVSQKKSSKTKLMPGMLKRARKRAKFSRRKSARKDATTDMYHPNHKMKEFFDNVEIASSQIAVVSDAADQIVVLKDRAILASSEPEELQISTDINRLVEDANGQARKCKRLLDSLRKEISTLNQEENANTTDMRVRDNLVITLSRKFKDETERYEQAQEHYKTDLKKKVRHQVQLLKPDATDEEVDQVMKSGGRDEMYRQLILEGEVNHEIKTEYQTVAGKYDVVVKLERSVAELHQIFLDLDLVTEEQGVLLDSIEYQLGSANDYIEDGNKETYEAILLQKKLRKKRLRVVFIVAGILVFVIAMIVA